MLYAYVDETGDRGPLSKKGASQCFGLGCVLLPTTEWANAIDHVLTIRRGLRDRHGIRVRSEIKANYLVNGGGSLAGLGLAPYVRKGIYRAHLRAIDEIGGKAFSVIVDKAKHPGVDWFGLAWETLLQRLEKAATRWTPSAETLMVIHDNGDNPAISKAVRKARVHLTAGSAFGSGSFRLTAPIIEDAIPRDSASSFMLQLADLVAYAGWRTYMPPGPVVQRVVPRKTWATIGAGIQTQVNSLSLNGSVPGVVLR